MRQFCFRLALQWGCSVRELLQRISSKELTEWMAFYNVEPFGEGQVALRSGIIASLIANIKRDTKKKITPFTPFDFIPKIYSKETMEKLEQAKQDVMSMKQKRYNERGKE